MKIDISYDQVLLRYPEQAKEVIAIVRKGKSKNKDADPSSFSWYFDWMQSMDMTKPLEERLLIALYAKIGRSENGVRIRNIPDEILNFYKEQDRIKEQERARYAALTPEQKQAEFENALAKLKSYGGFFIFQNKPS
jgi:hypothetical protein